MTRDRRIRLNARKEYYENKIRTLMDLSLPTKLVCLACWDAPVEREDLTTERGKRRFIKKCLKFYQKKLKEMEREARRL
ncbi:hypothetical protein HCU62_11265 [Dissulfurirhabdus thermomarina]|uniref:hypothetical protein n=1 Tax=Dissulfurirhabdus thermomarina TaxID=1765737 RepID=UPI001470742F|nr:hypothetical protein [Dissulfurirhabdus thermomarina]NMX24500.1 hypothetical protein [Dissulfurirhabdus thermomarina]